MKTAIRFMRMAVLFLNYHAFPLTIPAEVFFIVGAFF